MTHTRKLLIGTAGLVAIVMVALILAAPSMQRSIFYPKPRALPPVVEEKTEYLLMRLQSVLETNAPMIAQSLQPGLSEDRIAALEVEGRFRLSDDLRAFYKWHNGVVPNTSVGLLPGHRFKPLDELVRERAHATAAQGAVFSVFAGHRKGWVHVFDDGAGDGYFFDPQRSDAEGAFFFHFAEVGYYVWFPSFRNFLAGVIECYEAGAFKVSADGVSLEEDFGRTEKIWKRFAKESEE